MKHIVFSAKGIVSGFVIVLFLLGGWNYGETAPDIAAPGDPKPVEDITYYVDAVSGDDEDDGTSPDTAWKTLGRISQTKYGPGNKILLHRGQSWIDQTLYIGNGRDELETYLSGFSIDDPINVTMTNLRNSNIPELTYGTIDDVTTLDLTAGTVPESMVEFGSYGDPSSPNPIVKNVMIHWTTGIYIHEIDAFNNGNEYTTIMQHCMNMVLHDYNTPGMYTDYCHNVRLKNILSESSQEHGLYLCHSSTNFIIEDCIFRNNTASGIQTNGEDMNLGATDTTIVKRCQMYGNGISGYNDVRSRNMVFYRCLFVSGGPSAGKAVEVMSNSFDNQYYHSVFVSTVDGRPAIGMSGAKNTTFVNNIFYVQTDALTAGGSTISSDYNGFYAALPSDHSPIFNWSLSFDQWKTITGEDAHSMVTDPQFVSFDINGDPANWDLHLKKTSALIDQGTTVSAPLGESYTFAGLGPDIGMYEYIPALALRGTPGDRTIYLDWEVDTTLPATTTWHIDYYTTTDTVPFTATDPLSVTRSYVLTDVQNYQWYTVTLSAIGTNPALSDTVRVMPTDRVIYLPLAVNDHASDPADAPDAQPVPGPPAQPGAAPARKRRLLRG